LAEEQGLDLKPELEQKQREEQEQSQKRGYDLFYRD
jgi:uncharacterized ferritin-like protein (DUF455 family)